MYLCSPSHVSSTDKYGDRKRGLSLSLKCLSGTLRSTYLSQGEKGNGWRGDHSEQIVSRSTKHSWTCCIYTLLCVSACKELYDFYMIYWLCVRIAGHILISTEKKMHAGIRKAGGAVVNEEAGRNNAAVV
ncbi:hypothetical protein E2C01_073396 [Portunus trituberculatus]|uniref:Uncharacterized protein n=1 Tax=Portunus trituberculatus TaxID=210409 RepID=A0A5B7I9C0_PORTR|nr:hypothetical protein [Portunus trituberculatus]